MNKKRFTIKDIAKLSGVSAGTVDRVINNRGNVSEISEQKVKDVLKQVNFQPNVIARSLSRKKTYNIAILIPSFEKGEYWEDVDTGVERGLNEYSQFNVYAEKFYFDQYDRNSFVQAKNNLLSKDFNGVIMAPMFADDTIELSAELDEREIPYIYIDSDLKEGNPITYFGTDSIASGKVGAVAMLQTLNENSKILFLRTTNDEYLLNQCSLREKGFLEEINRRNLNSNIIEAEISLNSYESHQKLDEIFGNHQIDGAVIFNSRCYNYVNYLKTNDISPMWVLGYDAIAKNVDELKEGYISILIGQSPSRQGFASIKAMAEYLVMQIKPKRHNYMPIDLLIKENIEYYLLNQ